LDKEKSSILKNTDKLNELWRNKRSMPAVSSIGNNLPQIASHNNINNDLNEVDTSRMADADK